MHSRGAAPELLDVWSWTAEDALVEAAKDDPAAVAELYRRHADHVFRYLITCVDGQEEAADLTQQVFLRALQALPAFSPDRGTFRAWLTRIARNAAIDAHRRRRRAVPWELLPEALHPVLDQDPAGEVVRREALARLRTLVAGLPEDRRELLALRFAAGLSAAEIAAVVGAKEETVQKRLWRTLCALRERYDERT